MFSNKKTPLSYYESAIKEFEQTIESLAQIRQQLIDEISLLQTFKQELKDEITQKFDATQEDLKKEIDSLVTERIKTISSNYLNSNKTPSNFF